jgi:hypothetical protein
MATPYRIRLIKTAIEDNIDNPKPYNGEIQWGPWIFDKKHRTLTFTAVNKDGRIVPEYWIDIESIRSIEPKQYNLEDIKSAYDFCIMDNTVSSWAFHLQNKIWTEDHHLTQLVNALCTLFHAGFCKIAKVTA